MNRVKQFFAAPTFADETQTRRASLLSFIANLHIVIAVGLAALFLSLSLDRLVFPLAALLTCLPALGTRVLIRRGRVTLAALLFIGFIAVAMPVVALAGKSSVGSVSVTAFQFVTIVMAGLLLGRKGTFGFLVFTCMVDGVMLYAEANGWYPATVTRNHLQIWVTQTITYTAVAVLLWLANRLIQESFSRARRENDERQQAEAALQQSATYLEILHEIDRALLSAHTLEGIAMSALERIRKLIPCLRASVTLFDIEKNEAGFLAASFDNADHDFGDTVITLQEYGQYIIDELKQNNICRVDDVLSDPRANELDKQLTEVGFMAWLYLPLHYQGQLIGALNLGRGIGVPFTQRQEEIAADVATQLAIAIQQTRLYNALQNELEERKRAEAEREKLITELEAKNAELERFTYTVSHDLKSPLITIRGFLGFIEQDTQSGNTERLKADIQRIIGATDKMQLLMSELLELSRIGRMANPPDDVPFGEIVRDAVEFVRGQLDARNVRVTVADDLPIVHGDRARLIEVVQNLVDNAAKFMGNQTDPLIEIGIYGNDKDGKPIFFVRDNGIGIAPEYHERIFGLFNKLDIQTEGTGVGLTIAKRTVEFHGGRIWLESEPGRGSTFYFTLGSGDGGIE